MGTILNQGGIDMDVRIKWVFKAEGFEADFVAQAMDIKRLLYKHMADVKDRLFFCQFSSTVAKVALDQYAVKANCRKEDIKISMSAPYGFNAKTMQTISDFAFYVYSSQSISYAFRTEGTLRIVDALWMLTTSSEPLLERSRYTDILIDAIESKHSLSRGTAYVRIDVSSIRDALKGLAGEKDLIALFRINLRTPI